MQCVRYIMENVNNLEIITQVKECEIQLDTCWQEHNNPDHKSETIEHIKRNIKQVFKWKILCPAPSQKTSQEELRSNFYCIIQNIPKRSKSLIRLFSRNGITEFLIKMMISCPKVQIL